MKLAILQRSKRHSEVFGFIMEFCKDHGIELDIYVNKYRFWYGPYFNATFGTDFKDFDAKSIKPEDYDYIIATTSEDVKSVRGYPRNRIIPICHKPSTRRSRMKNMALTPLINRCSYIFPAYNAFSEVKAKKNIFVIVGNLKPRNIADVGRTLRKFKDRNLKIYVFTVSKSQPKDKRIEVVRGASTEYIAEICKKSKFLLSIPNPDCYYYHDRLTGELPLAISHNLPICLPKRLNRIYKLKGVVTYRRSLTEVFESLLDMKDEDYTKLVRELQENREAMIKENHRKLRSLFKVNVEENK